MTKRIIIILAIFAATLSPSAVLAQERQGGEIDAQIQSLEQDAAQNPNNPAALLRLEKLYSATGQPDKARALLERIIKLRPDDPAAYSELGYILDIANDHPAALKYHLLAVEKGPDDPVAHINLGLSYYYASRNDDASSEFNKAVKINLNLLEIAEQLQVYTPEEISANISDQVYYLSNLALCHLFINRPYKALEYLETAQGFAPGDPNIASLLSRTRDGIEAARRGESVTEEQQLAIRAAREALNRNDPSRAVEMYRELIAAGVDTEELRVNAGNAYFRLGAYGEALLQYQKAAQINAENPVSFFNLAEAYLQLGKSEEAFLSMRKAVELSPSYSAALSALGAMREGRGETAIAEKQLSRAAALSPRLEGSSGLLCSLYLRTNRPGQAAAFARRWLSASPGSPEAPACLASALHKSGDRALALETLRRAIASYPGNENLSSLMASISKPANLQTLASSKTSPADAAAKPAKAKVASKRQPAKTAASAKAKTPAVAKGKPPAAAKARTAEAPAKKPAASAKKPAAKKPVYVSVRIKTKSEITFKRKPAAVSGASHTTKTQKTAVAASSSRKQKPAAAAKKPVYVSVRINTKSEVTFKRKPAAIAAVKPVKAKQQAIKKAAAKKPAAKKKQTAVAASSTPKQKHPTAAQKPAAESANISALYVENASQPVKPAASTLTASIAPGSFKLSAAVKHAASAKPHASAKHFTGKKKPANIAGTLQPEQNPVVAQAPVIASVEIAAPYIESASSAIRPAASTPVAAAGNGKPAQPAAASNKPRAVKKPAAAAASSKKQKAAAAAKQTVPAAAKPARKKKPAAVITASPIAKNPSVAVKQQYRLAGELPVLPGLSDGVKGQLASAGITPTMPGSEYFDPKALQRLRAGVTGAWIYQNNSSEIWARKSGGAKYLRLAEGIQPSLTSDKKTVVYIARNGSTRVVKALSLTNLSTKTLLDDAKFKRGSPGAFFKQPAISPDGKHLSVLVESGAGIFDLTLRRLDTGTIMRPLPGYNVDYYAWDPSGDRIIFSSDPCGKDSDGKVSCIGSLTLSTGAVAWLDSSIPPAEEGERKVYIGGMTRPVFSFSPSGKTLLMYDADSYSGTVIIVELAGNRAAKLTPRDVNGDRVDCENFAWSPDGNRLAFTSDSYLWVMNLDGSGAFPVQQLSGGVSPPFYWLP